MTYLGCFLINTLGDYLAAVLVGGSTLNNLDCGAELGNEHNESY